MTELELISPRYPTLQATTMQILWQILQLPAGLSSWCQSSKSAWDLIFLTIKCLLQPWQGTISWRRMLTSDIPRLGTSKIFSFKLPYYCALLSNEGSNYPSGKKKIYTRRIHTRLLREKNSLLGMLAEVSIRQQGQYLLEVLKILMDVYFKNNDIFSISSLTHPARFVLRQSALQYVILLPLLTL